VDLVEQHLIASCGLTAKPLIAKRPLLRLAEYSINAPRTGEAAADVDSVFGVGVGFVLRASVVMHSILLLHPASSEAGVGVIGIGRAAVSGLASDEHYEESMNEDAPRDNQQHTCAHPDVLGLP
jgi:hypothetical protein